ncbi:MAG: STAS domain-containing protein [Kiritimatiellae bacterium]|nr:STAS domain-containing protein [Kiritimatiellia bacterium]
MVWLDAGRAWIRVTGRGTLSVGPPLREFIQHAEQQGVQEAVLELDECDSMDSTFLGLIAGFAMRLRRAGGRMLAVSPGERVRRLLHTLGVDRLLEIAPVAPAAGQAAGEELRPSSVAGSRETVLEAHETLASVSEANRERFRDVIEFLRERSGGVSNAPGGR